MSCNITECTDNITECTCFYYRMYINITQCTCYYNLNFFVTITKCTRNKVNRFYTVKKDRNTEGLE